MNRHVIIAASLAIAAGIISWTAITYLAPTTTQEGENFTYETAKIEIGDAILEVEIADEGGKISQGLMYRQQLPPDKGMLFVFEDAREWQFWTMNMKFNIDMMWIDADGKVVHIVENAEPCIDAAHTSLCTYSPDEPAVYVLETNAGFALQHGIGKGSVMRFLT